MGVEFEENQFNPRTVNNSESVPRIAGWLISKGIVKTVAAANGLQIGAAVLFFIIAIVLMF